MLSRPNTNSQKTNRDNPNTSSKNSSAPRNKSMNISVEKIRQNYYKRLSVYSQHTKCNDHNINNSDDSNKRHTKDMSGITVITSTIRPQFMDSIFENYNRQTYKKKELIIILNKNSMDINLWKEKAKQYANISVFQIDEEVPLGECYNFCVEKSTYDYIAPFDDDDYYAPNYLQDIVEAFKISNADVVGKRARYVYFENSGILAISGSRYENSYVNYIDGPTLSFNKKIFDRVQFSNIPCGIDVQFCKDCTANGIKIYSTNRFNHVYIRHSSSHDHTWKINDNMLLMYGGCRVVRKTNNYQKYITR
ncbi:glycosyltransferase family 2 protein [Alkaliphilus sp. MSJ-5]|uniref:Glycosyltransferase family 2 protein n=1 Tax=Alkaliphilus flagellatus TaxID=2841507 RepID=A0ABS6FXY1_9FIRM|nr:glycosyltransferase family 2 protein [Alkaliphilus flagellatus]MBU5675083.1 glycosyltransferase family 2 protein [Alkaliphilus flagellatus]